MGSLYPRRRTKSALLEPAPRVSLPAARWYEGCIGDIAANDDSTDAVNSTAPVVLLACRSRCAATGAEAG